MSHQHVLLRLCLAHKDGLQVEVQKSTLKKQKHQTTATSQPTHSSPHTTGQPGVRAHRTLPGRQPWPLRRSFASIPTYDSEAEVSAPCSALQPNTLNRLTAISCLPFLQEGRWQKAAVLAIYLSAQATAKSHISGTSSINLSQLL